MSLYVHGQTKIPEPIPEEKIKKQRELEQHQRYLERKIRRYKRLEAGTMDAEQAKVYTQKRKQAQAELKEFIAENDKVLKRDYFREKVYEGETEKKVLTNAKGDVIIETKKTSLTGTPNSITQVVNKKGGIDRNYYGNNGDQKLQISNNDHGNPKAHPFGEHGEHAHDYYYDETGKLIRGEGRDLTDEERERDGDML